jgi:hypothetical protein
MNGLPPFKGSTIFYKFTVFLKKWDVPDYLVFKDNGREFGIFDYNLGKFLNHCSKPKEEPGRD